MTDTITTGSEGTTQASYRKKKRFVLVSMLIFAACVGGVSVFLPEDTHVDRVTDIICGLLALWLVYSWCSIDARERSCKMSSSMSLCLILFFGVAFPYYIFKSRGLGGFKTMGYAGLFIVGMIVTAGLAGGIGSLFCGVG